MLDVLRKGVKDSGCYVQSDLLSVPASGMNPDLQQRYAQNRFALIRQLKYSQKNEKVAGHGAVSQRSAAGDHGAEEQSDRSGGGGRRESSTALIGDPREPLFRFRRCMVHFAVGNEKVSMTTHLQGGETRFFPYNRGIENPVNPDGHKTAYLWEDILQPDNLMELIGDFIHEQEVTQTRFTTLIIGEVKDVKRTSARFPAVPPTGRNSEIEGSGHVQRGRWTHLPNPTRHRQRQNRTLSHGWRTCSRIFTARPRIPTASSILSSS